MQATTPVPKRQRRDSTLQYRNEEQNSTNNLASLTFNAHQAVSNYDQHHKNRPSAMSVVDYIQLFSEVKMELSDATDAEIRQYVSEYLLFLELKVIAEDFEG